MYISVKYEADSRKKNRWISLCDTTTVREIEEIVDTLRCIPGVDEVYVNVTDVNRKKDDNN